MLRFENVQKQYRGGMFGTDLTKAVDCVNFSIGKNERIGLLGESGCGKSTISRLATKLITPTKGKILFEGRNINSFNAKETKEFHRSVQIIFQNPQQAFNPRMTLYDSIAEPLRLYHLTRNKDEERAVISEYMSLFGLSEDIYTRYPQEISGGQAQRIAIMRIILLEPKLIIADEPTTMLDVSVQAQILRLLQDIMDKKGTSLLVVSHDLDVIRAMCNKIIVMKEGKIVEINRTEEIFEHPVNEYTRFIIGRKYYEERALVSAV